MCSHVRVILYASMIVLLALASAFSVIPARADDGAPPPPAGAAGHSAKTAITTSDLSKVPSGTDVVVLNRSGHKVDMASQEAAHIIAAGDPIWCPLGVAPIPSLVGPCSPAETGLNYLETWMSLSAPSKSGVIWLEYNYNSFTNDSGTTTLMFDGLGFPDLANYNLTINGGWNGMSGSTITDPTNPSTFEHATLNIINWHASIAISNILVTGVTTSPYGPYALHVQTDKGGITLNHVQVADNYAGLVAAGAFLDTSGAALGFSAPVTVNESVFNDNYGDGLHIRSNGAVNIRNLTADDNGGLSYNGDGADINNQYSNPNEPVTLTGTNEFKGNFGIGLYIVSNGAVSLNNITAYYNDTRRGGGSGGFGTGVVIDDYTDSTPSNVTLTGTNLLTYNATGGLSINSNGNISLNNLASTDNRGSGAELNNCIPSALYGPCTTTGKTVTLTGVNTFNRNTGGDGLLAYTSGTISISQVTANDNGGDGVHLDNCASTVAGACQTLLPYNVTITNASTFMRNVGDGLNISATGSVTLKNITASLNQIDGADIYNNAHLTAAPPVTMSGNNSFNGNTINGLVVISYGAITASNLTANDNGWLNSNGTGVDLENAGFDLNAGGTGIAGDTVIRRMPVTVTGTNTFDHNFGGGLEVYSVGAISVSSVSASNNHLGNGVYLSTTNDWYPNHVTPAKPYAANVTLSGFGLFENNGWDGLSIAGTGMVTLANLTADNNYNDGTDVGTFGFTLPQSVTLTGVNTFFGNGAGSGIGDGLKVQNDGAITISNLSANNNQRDGADITNNAHLTAAEPVTISGNNVFNGNTINGLVVISYGAITASNLTANDNGWLNSNGTGVDLENAGFDVNAGGTGVSGATVITRTPVTLTGTNTFDHNFGGGLEIYSAGAISVSNVSASNNHLLDYGVLLFNTYDWYPNFVTPSKPYAANVTLSGFGLFENNGWDGLGVSSTGVVTLANLTADNNYNDGAHIGTSSLIGPQSVTLTGVNTFYNNGIGLLTGDGLYVQNDGAITISNLSASNNAGNGAYLDNHTWSWPNKFLGVTLTGFNTFQQNKGLYGLHIDTGGSATMTNVDADMNTGTGVYVLAAKNITLTCVGAFENAVGLHLSAVGSLTLTNVHSYYNTSSDVLSEPTIHTILTCP